MIFRLLLVSLIMICLGLIADCNYYVGVDCPRITIILELLVILS